MQFRKHFSAIFDIELSDKSIVLRLLQPLKQFFGRLVIPLELIMPFYNANQHSKVLHFQEIHQNLLKLRIMHSIIVRN